SAARNNEQPRAETRPTTVCAGASLNDRQCGADQRSATTVSRRVRTSAARRKKDRDRAQLSRSAADTLWQIQLNCRCGLAPPDGQSAPRGRFFATKIFSAT